MTDHLIAPHGGQLIDLIASSERCAELHKLSRELPSWDLTPRQLCDLELLMVGGFSPLTGFMKKDAFDAVCTSMSLPDGTLWPIPITLDVTEQMAESLNQGGQLALRDAEGVMLAVLHVEDIWEHDREADAQAVYGTLNKEHPGVDHLFHRTNNISVGGRIEGAQLPAHYDFLTLRRTPEQLRRDFSRRGWRKIVAFQTRNLMHRAHYEMTLKAARQLEANLLIHPAVGMHSPGDLEHYTRVRCYQELLRYYPQQTVQLSLLPLAMRMAGPREAMWHAIVRKNYGCTHFIVGCDHAGATDGNGKPFYEDYAAQDLLNQYADELGIEMVPFKQMVYVEEKDDYRPVDEAPEDSRVLSLTDAELRSRLDDGRDIPDWFTYPEVAKELRRTYPPRPKQGFTVFFTGLSGSGKSTIAQALQVKLLEMGGRPLTVLDGDLVRKNLSSELGFSKEHRDINIRRIGYVASEITKNGGIAICAPIAPYARIRDEVRAMIDPLGGFVLVYVATPLEICEERDRKGLYAKARAGQIKAFTGISDPYEEPKNAEVVIDTTEYTPDEAAQEIILYLEREGYIGGQYVEDM